ncbi:hypothetical protein PF004_g28081 [Phytophthora fragariae]|uniref:Uncharacterized protein n=1 Tax=Phytophthora fragariae TaxID=53985 RepID=A0A6G0MJH5_9STRA|nr:hypothetical protein PF004_g28081 [Phytophthora fragariae]
MTASKSRSTSKEGCGDVLRLGGEVVASFAEAAWSFVDARVQGTGELAPLIYPGFGVSVSDDPLLTSGSSTSERLGGSFRAFGLSVGVPFFLGSCLAAGFFTAGFFEAGFDEATTFFVFRVDFGGADVFFAFDLVAAAAGFLEAGGFFASPASFAFFFEAGVPFASSASFAGFLEADATSVSCAGYVEAGASFVASGSPECFLEAGAGGFSSMSLGVGASAWFLAGPPTPRVVGAARTMICVSVVMPGGRSGAHVCSKERELPNEAVLAFPLDSPLGKVLPVWVREGVMGPGLASDLFKEKGCSLVWTTPAGVAHKD